MIKCPECSSHILIKCYCYNCHSIFELYKNPIILTFKKFQENLLIIDSRLIDSEKTESEILNYFKQRCDNYATQYEKTARLYCDEKHSRSTRILGNRRGNPPPRRDGKAFIRQRI